MFSPSLRPYELISGWIHFLPLPFRWFSVLVCVAAEAAGTSQQIDAQGASLRWPPDQKKKTIKQRSTQLERLYFYI